MPTSAPSLTIQVPWWVAVPRMLGELEQAQRQQLVCWSECAWNLMLRDVVRVLQAAAWTARRQQAFHGWGACP